MLIFLHMTDRSKSLLFLALLALAAGPVAAAEYEEPTVDSISVTGRVPFGRGHLLDGSGLEEGASLFSITRSEVRSAIMSNLVSRGYLEAEVTVTWPSWRDTMSVVSVDVSPGMQSMAGGVVLGGVGVFSPKRISGMYPLDPGDAVTPEALGRFEQDVQSLYQRYGYARARVNVYAASGDTAAADSGRVLRTVECHVEEGSRLYMGDVEVKGLRTVREQVVTREIPLARGDSLNMVLLRESVGDIYSVGLFRDVRFQYPGLDEESDTVDVRVMVTEKDYHRVDLGTGYLSPYAVLGSAYWEHPNIWGNNQRLRIGATYKRYLGKDGGDVFEPEMTYTEPWFLSTRWEWNLGLSYTYFQLPSLEERSLETSTGLQRELARDLKLGLGYSLDRDRIRAGLEEGGYEETDWTTSSRVWTQLAHDTRDPLLDPVRGHYISGRAELSGGPLGGRDFYKLEGEARVMRTMTRGLVLAWRLKGGTVFPFGESSIVPPKDRFYLGGSSTVRGYGFRDIGPEDEEGNPLGGRVMALGNAEVRVSVWGPVGTALFVDVGGLWQTTDEIAAGSTGFGTGIGIRVSTPFGPIRLDYGFAPTWRESLRRGRVYIALGQAF
ncbi:MAG: BamA/TamA family outer membrane protein [Candidatus Fermentibacteraceae bacterium]